MEDITYSVYFVIITIVTITSTIIISLKKDIRKMYKYLPSIIVFIGSIIYCIVITVADYNRYIGIVYVGVFFTVLPAILLSLITASVFDLMRYISEKTNKNANTKQ